MTEASLFQNRLRSLDDVRIDIQELALVLKKQAKETPKAMLTDFGFYQEVLKKLKDEVTPFLDKLVYITPKLEEFTNITSIDSTILTRTEDKAIIKQWLKDYGSPKLKLLYRGSRDGFDAETFHYKCGDYAPTLTVIKSNFQRVFGGFTDQDWTVTGGYKGSSRSWLFSLDERERYLIKPELAHKAIRCKANCGPTFGGGCDIYIAENCMNATSCSSNFGHTYDAGKWSRNEGKRKSLLAGDYCFGVDEIEVFYVEES